VTVGRIMPGLAKPGKKPAGAQRKHMHGGADIRQIRVTAELYPRVRELLTIQ
jgi:hypothetical protein